MLSPRVEAGFEALGSAPHPHRFCVWTEPATGEPAGLIVYVHPFAEEMNKSRRMATLQAGALAERGFSVLQVDLLGCGDSAGDSGDAAWVAWVEDVAAGCRLATARFAQRWPGRQPPPLWLWGLRSGCLLAVAAAQRLTEPWRFIFWQPVLSGRTFLQQFLRLDTVAASIGNAGRPRESAKAALAAGRSALVAGYIIGPALAHGMEAARLVPPTWTARVLWFDVATRSAEDLPPAVRKALDEWRHADVAVDFHAVVGPAFWSTTEIEEAPTLIDATIAALESADLRRAADSVADATA